MARPPKNPTIPLRDGVSPSCLALPSANSGGAFCDAPGGATDSAPDSAPGSERWASLLDHLAERLPLPGREGWAQRLASGLVLDEAGRALGIGAPFVPGARVYYYRALAHEAEVPFQARVLFQDAHLLVADKPHFLPVTPGGRYLQQSLLVRLKRSTGLEALSPIHRIDRETAGLVLFCVRPQDRAAYQALFRERVVHKHYEAMARHDPSLRWPLVRRSRLTEDPAAFFRMTESAGPPNSETRIQRLEQRGGWARYGLEPLTGQRHQLRVHMAALGLPLAGDQLYPRVLRGPGEAEDFSNPLRLLARRIAFTDPHTQAHRVFESQQQLQWPESDPGEVSP